MRKVLLCGAMLSLLACSRDEDVQLVEENHSSHSHAHWDYENPDWGSQGYSECAGLVQSPIDIVTSSAIPAPLPKIDYAYNPFVSTNSIDNGHSVQVNVEGGNSITYNGLKYNLAQFHYHVKSEHTVDGAYMPMEVHFVHKNEETGAIMVLGVFVEGGATQDNEAYAGYLSAFPKNKNEQYNSGANINPLAMYPTNNQAYYNYTGSLTTPPCSQGIDWIVMKESVKISDSQLSEFAKVYNHNYRPVQKLGGRKLYVTQ